MSFGSDFAFFPNPVNGDSLNIALGESIFSSVNIGVSNALGQILSSSEHEVHGNSVILEGMSTLSKGVYFVSVTNGLQTLTEKIIIN